MVTIMAADGFIPLLNAGLQKPARGPAAYAEYCS